jgi:hypothetical protein
MIEHRATKPLERHTLLVQHDEDQRPRFLARAKRRAGGRGAKGPGDEIVHEFVLRHNQHTLKEVARGFAADLRVNLPRYSHASLYVISPI